VRRPDWEPILDAFARCARILPGGEVYELRPEALNEPAEKALFDAYEGICRKLDRDYNIGEFLSAFELAVPAVSQFFEKLMVMDKDPVVRENRLALLQSITNLAQGRADLRQLVGF